MKNLVYSAIEELLHMLVYLNALLDMDMMLRD